MEDPKQATKLVRREVTRVMTPGTAADSALASEDNNFLAAVARMSVRKNAAATGSKPHLPNPGRHGAPEESGAKAELVVGFAALDLSTGEFHATEFRGEDAERR